MNKSTKFRAALKPIITTLSVLALSWSAISYGGYDKSADSAIPSKPYFYTGSDTDGALEFDQYIIRDHYGFAVSLALKTAAPKVYRILQDTKTYMFQQNQIALMQDVLDELKAVNQNLADRSAIPKPESQQQRIKRLAKEINKYPIHSSYSGTLSASQIAELKSQFEEVGNYWHPSNNKGNALAKFIELANKLPEDNDRDNILRWPVGSVASKTTALGEVDDYYANQLAKQNALFAKNRITELPMQPKSKAIDWSKIEMPRITSSNSGIDVVLPENFKLISSEELVAAKHLHQSANQDKRHIFLVIEEAQSFDLFRSKEYFNRLMELVGVNFSIALNTCAIAPVLGLGIERDWLYLVSLGKRKRY